MLYLSFFFFKEFEEEECAYFFNKTLPAMIQLALRLPQLVTQPPPLLLQGTSHSITLSQMQVSHVCMDVVIYV